MPQSSPMAPHAPAAPDDPLAGRRVLVVDDSRAVCVLLEELLGAHGADVVVANTFESALARHADGAPYDLVLLDLILPGAAGDGLALLERMRAVDVDSAIVMLTGAGGVTSAIDAVRKGADGYMEKSQLDVSAGGEAFVYALARAMQLRAGVRAHRELEAMRTDFYSMVTHDLRNPTGSVLAVLRLLLAEKAGPLAQPQRDLLAIALRSGEKLRALIDDVLDFAKIEAGSLALERRPEDLGALARAVAALAAPQARVRGQALTVDVPAVPVLADVDAERVEQVLDNLLSNALKYTPDGGAVWVQVAEEGGTAVLRVRDTGPGIAPARAHLLFAKYQRAAGTTTRGIVGTGLGLVIVKEVVAAHGGTITVDSTGVAGEGATFTVRFPLAAPALADVAA